jgi:hypothetical protein
MLSRHVYPVFTPSTKWADTRGAIASPVSAPDIVRSNVAFGSRLALFIARGAIQLANANDVAEGLSAANLGCCVPSSGQLA